MLSKFFPVSHILPCSSDTDDWVWLWTLLQYEIEASESGGQLAFTWLHKRLEWGPTKWPARWSDLACTDVCDCGLFADLCEMVLLHEGVLCARVQELYHVSDAESSHYRALWDNADVSYKGWILENNYVYHELLAVVVDDEVYIYDPTNNTLLTAPQGDKQYQTYMRLCESISVSVSFNGVELVEGEWVPVRCL